MYQGETIATVISDLPIPVSEIQSLYIVFTHHSTTLLEKTLEDCTVDEELQTIICRLSQEESLSFPKGQIRRSIIVITKDGSRFETDPVILECGKTVKNEVLT